MTPAPPPAPPDRAVVLKSLYQARAHAAQGLTALDDQIACYRDLGDPLGSPLVETADAFHSAYGLLDMLFRALPECPECGMVRHECICTAAAATPVSDGHTG